MSSATKSTTKPLVGVVVVAVLAIIAGFFVINPFNLNANGAQGNFQYSSPLTSEGVQCRVNAVVGYMGEQGFTDGQYVVGEDRIDRNAPEFSSAGSLAFGKDGHIVDSRDKLQEVFESSDPTLQAVTQAQINKFSNVDKAILLNSHNWEIVQSTIPMSVGGNTGFDSGTVVAAGTRESAAGDAAWIFTDPATCTVPRSDRDSLGNAVDPSLASSEKPVGMVRVGCINITDSLKPKPPVEQPPVETPPVETPPTHENPPPDKPVCPWNPALPPDSPDCVQPKSSNPNDYRRPGDGGGGRDSGEGTKPLAPVTTVQPAPAPVEESRTGGGGIVDAPSNPPASESGVTAPEATPAPTTPSSPPPNEGGSNEGEVTRPSW